MDRYYAVFFFIVSLLLGIIGWLLVQGFNSMQDSIVQNTSATKALTQAVNILGDEFHQKSVEHDMRLDNVEIRLDKGGL